MIDLERTQFSECGKYRYTLRRDFTTGMFKVLFVMLNPSIADARLDDPTTRRAVDFARTGLRCGNYMAVNLFALRSTDPKGLRAVADPIGPENDAYLLAAAKWADEIVVAWGIGGSYLGRDKQVVELLNGRPLWCFGRTKHGHPRFPLYLAKTTDFERFTDHDGQGSDG